MLSGKGVVIVDNEPQTAYSKGKIGFLMTMTRGSGDLDPRTRRNSAAGGGRLSITLDNDLLDENANGLTRRTWE